MLVRRFVLAIAAAACATGSAAADGIPGPVPADVIRVVDGDTIKVRARIWVDQSVEVSVRLAGIDAPEVYRPRCQAEKAPARAATDAVKAIVGDQVMLREIRNGKYAGRVVARAETLDGEDLSAWLLAQGHAIAEGAPKPWCVKASETS